MLLENKYSRCYHKIISLAKQDLAKRKNDYFEKHHIIPKCLGGSNEKSNLVFLTAREHFVCHRLLTKMTTGEDKAKMHFALNMFTQKHTHRKKHLHINSRTYNSIKKEFAKSISIINKGKILSEDTKKKLSLSKQITHRTEQFRMQASIRAKDRPADYYKKIGLKHKGKTISAEMKRKQSEKLSGEKNPRALTWKIVFEDGSPDKIIKSLKSWCLENDRPYGMIFRTSTVKKFHNGVMAIRTLNHHNI
jgi:hypothetical protein